jgi:hypothetical protein
MGQQLTQLGAGQLAALVQPSVMAHVRALGKKIVKKESEKYDL